jgi:hypothetical protein
MALVGLVLGVTSFDRIVLTVLVPGGPFDAARSPSAPDYGDPAAWSALPEREDAADLALPDFPAIDQAAAPVDVFYVHSTTYVGRRWNAPIDDDALNRATDEVSTLIQASAFNACCAIHAPRYRQANGTAFSDPTSDGSRAIDLAYRDVANAFRHFLKRREASRPFILVSHSQGSVHAYRLLREEVSGTPLRQQLVAAYVIGVPLMADALERELPDIPVCGTPEQTGCIIGWNARSPDFAGGVEILRLPDYEPRGGELDPGQRVCVNPLTWRHDDTPAAASLNAGGVFLETDPPTFQAGFASAHCKEGTLVVSEIAKAPRNLASRLLDRALGEGNYHPIEYQIFFLNLRLNAQERVSSHLKAPGSGVEAATPDPHSRLRSP